MQLLGGACCLTMPSTPGQSKRPRACKAWQTLQEKIYMRSSFLSAVGDAGLMLLLKEGA